MKAQNIIENTTIESIPRRFFQHAGRVARSAPGKFLVAAVITISLVAVPMLTHAGQTNEEKKLTGSWVGTVTRANPAPGQSPTVLNLVTFFEDGNLIQEGSDPGIRSAGRGKWKRIGHQQFTQSFLNFRFDAARAFIGTRIVTSTITLSEDGNQYHAETGAEFFDAAGNLLSSGVGATEVAQRVY